MADGSKKTSTFSRVRNSLKMKDKSKAGKDPPDVTRSSAAAAVAQPKGKRSSKDKKEEKKREKSRRSSSKSSVESPPSGSVRDSFILQSPSVLAVEDRLQHGSPPGGEESALSGNSSGATRGELFTDDPLRVEDKSDPPAECEVKRKPLDEHSLETHLKQIELQLQEKEKEFHQDSSNKSLPERLQALLGRYEERYECVSSEKSEMARAHEKASTVEEHLKELETKKNEAKLRHEKEVAQIREHSQALEKKLQEEKKTMMREHTAAIDELKMEAEGEKKRHEDEHMSMKSEHARELGKLRDKVEKMTTRLKGTEDELLEASHKLEQLQQENQAFVKQMREEAQREVLQTKQAVTQKEEENRKLSGEVAELKTKCGEQQATITELENSVTATTTKLHSQEKLARSYEDMMKKLEQRLENEVAKTAALKEQPQGSAPEHVQGDNFQTELKKKEVELTELQTQLQTAREQLHEEKTKSETELQKKEENLEQLQLQLQSTQKRFTEEKANTEEELERNKEELEKQDQLLQKTQRELQEQEEMREIELRKKEEELAEARRQLDATEERLREQEEKREESQRKLESFQKAVKAEASTAKSAADLNEYFDNMTKLCEEMTEWKKKSEDLKKKVDKLQKVVGNAERMEKAYVEATKKLSEVEANKEVLRSQAPAVAGGGREGGKQSPGAGATWTESSPEPQGVPSVRRLKREVQDLREKLQARDEEVRTLKSQQGNTPLANPPLSPTDSMAAETGEVASLKLKLRERETKLHNLEVQVSSMERDLQEREKLKRTSESLRSDVEKLTREKKTISEYSKQQSQQVLSLKKALEAKQRETQTKMPADSSQSSEIQRFKTAVETAQQELQNFKTKVEDLTRELDERRSEKAEMAQQFKEKAESLKEAAEKTKLRYSVFQEENQKLKQMVEELKSEVTAEKKASFVTADEHKKEVEMLKEGSHQKDLLMQHVADDIKQLESQLTAAEGKYKELEECNRDILRTQEQAMEDGMKQNDELEKLKEEVKVKTAQVTQFKKHLEGKHNTIPTEQVEKLQIELATSRSSLEDTAKQLKDLSFKHAEMEKHYAKKIQEVEKQLQVMTVENLRMVKESETHRRLVEKQKELQLNQAQMQQAEMANELTRLQMARNREDEFSKAFHEEFEAHRVMKAKYAELQHQLDTALDSLDGTRQKQEVLIQTLVDHRVAVPFVEPRQLPPANNMAQAATETLQWSTQPPTPVAISQKPIASPGVFNQGVDRVSYMPPHSNAESQYQEQQAGQRVSHWQQQQLSQHQQQHMYQQVPPLSPQPRAVPSCQQADTDAVVGIPASAVIRLIVPRSSQHLSHTTHLPGPLQSRHSDSEIQSGRVVREQQPYPLSPHRTRNPNAQLPSTVGEVSGMGQNQPQKVGHPQLQPGLRGQSQPNVYSGHPQQQQGGVIGQPQPPNSNMGPAQMVNRGEPQPHNVGQSPHMGHPGGNFLARDQPPKHKHVFPPPSQAMEFVGQHDPYHQRPNSQAPSSRTPIMPVPSARTTNAATDLCFQRQQPLASQPYKTTLPGGARPSQYPQAEFVKPVAETVLPPQSCPSTNPAVSDFNERSKTGANSVAPRKASDTNDEEQGLMENLSTTIKETFKEINEEEQTPSIQSGLPSLPPDPNLQCVMCGKVFKIGQIQNFKRHSETCTGTRSK